jgi:acyl-CoA hydrolase
MFDYSKKLIGPKEALEKIESDSFIVAGFSANEPQLFLKNLHTIADRVKNVTVTVMLPMTDGEFYSLPNFNIDSWFFNGLTRKYFETGRVSYIPNCLRFCAEKRKRIKPTDVFISAATMPDDNGDVCLPTSNVYDIEMLNEAKLIILEINPNLPRINGDQTVNLSKVDYVMEADYFLPEIPDVVPNEKDRAIGKLIAAYINDGDCVQVGIGGIPNAICEFLSDKKDLGIHTEMYTTGIMRLTKNGVVTNKFKQTDVGRSVCCFALGTKEMYEFLDGNPDVLVRSGAYVNDPQVIKQNDNQVSINTTIEIDLTGQCCSESIGARQFSGTGGQTDTAVGAQLSKNGRSFIALYSSAMVKDPATGGRVETSKIVPFLKPGAAVTLSRNDVEYAATEYGIVNLKGLTVAERAAALISIAHPRFREELQAEAKKLGYLRS